MAETDTSEQSSILDNMLASAKDQIDQAINSVGEFSNILKAASPEIEQSLDSVGRFFATLPSLGIERATISLAEKPITLLKGALDSAEELARGTIETSNVISRVTGIAAGSYASLGIASDQALSKFAENTFELVNKLADVKTKFIAANGAIITADALLFGTATEQLNRYTETLINDTRLYKFAAESLGKENEGMVRGINRTQLALRLDARDVNLIFQNELSKTGQLTGAILSEFERAVVATQRATGIAAEKSAKTMIDIMRDFNTFGDITTSRAAELTVTLNNLGINLSDLTSVVGKFQSFDAATQAMSNFSAITGATLDTLELFRLANEDPEAFVVDLKDQLEAQGIQFEELNLIQQRQLAQGFGLDPRVLQRLMNENIESITGASYSLEEKIAGTTAEDAEMFLNSMADSQRKAREQVDKLLEIKTQAAAASLDVAKSIESAGSSVIAVNNRIIDSLGGIRDAAIESQEALRAAMTTLSTGLISAAATPVAPGGAATTVVPSPPGTSPPATAPPAAATSTPAPVASPPIPVSVTTTGEVTVTAESGNALAEALAPLIAVRLMAGVNADSKTYTFVTTEPSG